MVLILIIVPGVSPSFLFANENVCSTWLATFPFPANLTMYSVLVLRFLESSSFLVVSADDSFDSGDLVVWELDVDVFIQGEMYYVFSYLRINNIYSDVPVFRFDD